MVWKFIHSPNIFQHLLGIGQYSSSNYYGEQCRLNPCPEKACCLVSVWVCECVQWGKKINMEKNFKILFPSSWAAPSSHSVLGASPHSGHSEAFMICSLPSRKGPDPQEKARDWPAVLMPGWSHLQSWDEGLASPWWLLTKPKSLIQTLPIMELLFPSPPAWLRHLALQSRTP